MGLLFREKNEYVACLYCPEVQLETIIYIGPFLLMLAHVTIDLLPLKWARGLWHCS